VFSAPLYGAAPVEVFSFQDPLAITVETVAYVFLMFRGFHPLSFFSVHWLRLTEKGAAGFSPGVRVIFPLYNYYVWNRSFGNFRVKKVEKTFFETQKIPV
jgi:hypothetical protein